MQPLQLFLALSPAFIATLAQSAAESALPQCAQEAFFAAIPPSGCQISDAHCICSNPSLLQAIHSAIQGACSPADQAAAAAFASSYCITSASSLSGSATGAVTATETASTSTVANLPSSISAPASTSTPSGTLVHYVDDDVLWHDVLQRGDDDDGEPDDLRDILGEADEQFCSQWYE
ncbi:hypothetical protein LTR12_001724 [Friedmanniomyces endolithicus]|nr:hypothetical protein LTR74_007284 [Friedmanniomyces endolithicus]KAK1823769.1 hypothetical protein LTR12_001724 [Friedmanniomyces endolithicus]